jgi:hypothetical protein
VITLNQPRTSGPVSRRLLAFLAMAMGLIVTPAATATTTASAANFAYDVPGIALVDIRGFEAASASPTQVSVARDGSASLVVEVRVPSTTPSSAFLATEAVDDVFHYTKGEFVDSISTNGLRPGSYATPNGGLSPLQARIDLALPPNTGLRDAVMRVDVAGLREAGYEIPAITRVTGTVTGPGGRVYTMPGGGYEMQFPYAIPPEFIKVVTP